MTAVATRTKRGTPPPPRHLGQKAILERKGWNNQLIHSLLGPPEISRPSVNNPNHTVRLWSAWRVGLAETHPRLKGSLEADWVILSQSAGIKPGILRVTEPKTDPRHEIGQARRLFIAGRFILPMRARHQPHGLMEMLEATFPNPLVLDARDDEPPHGGAQRGAGSHVLISALAHAYPHLWSDLKDYAVALDLLGELGLTQLVALHPTSLPPSLNTQIGLARKAWEMAQTPEE